MIRTIFPGRVKGHVSAPSSKSVTQRAIAAALLAEGTTTIKNPSLCNDSDAALRMAVRLGASVERDAEEFHISGSKGHFSQQILHCGESGLAMRMFAPLATLFADRVTFTGDGSLLSRPVTMITDALRQMGVETESHDGFLPLTLKGRLRGGRYYVDGSAGSQLITGLLMTLPLLEDDSELTVENLTSRPYIDLTMALLEDFGIKTVNNGYHHFSIPGRQRYVPCSYTAEGDWSGGAFLLVAGAIAGSVVVDNLFPDSRQADRLILEALKMAGADLSIKENTVAVSRDQLNPFAFDAGDSPDLFPPLAALASCCEGTSTITGVRRLKHKESNRAETIIKVLSSLGIRAEVMNDDMIITGTEPQGAVVSSFHDHRIAMMASVIALRTKGNVIITEAEATAKSYPEFYNDMMSLGAFIR